VTSAVRYLIQSFSLVCRNTKFIILFTKARNLSLYETSFIQSQLPQPRNLRQFSPPHPLGTILQSNLIPSGLTTNFLRIISSLVGAIFYYIIKYDYLKFLLFKIIYYLMKGKGNKLFNYADNLTSVNLLSLLGRR